MTGTARYASLNTHLGIEQSRRDDLEALGFVLMYFAKGSLPWQGLRAKTKQEKYDAIKEKKMTTTIETLCQGQPEEFSMYLNACRKLQFDEKPDYGLLRKFFKDLFVRKGYEYDYVYDWLIQKLPIKQAPVTESKLPIENKEEKKEETRHIERAGSTQLKEETKKLPEETKAVKKLENPPSTFTEAKPAPSAEQQMKSDKAMAATSKLLLNKQPVHIVRESAATTKQTGLYSRTMANSLKMPSKASDIINGMKTSVPGPKIVTTNPRVIDNQ